MAENKKNVSGDGKEGFITFKAEGLDNEMYYRCRMTTRLIKMMRHYSERVVGLPINSLRFLLGNRRICGDDTPKELEMENDDVIDVHQVPPWPKASHQPESKNTLK